MNVTVPIDFVERGELVKVYDKLISASRRRSSNASSVDEAQRHLDKARRLTETRDLLDKFKQAERADAEVTSVTLVPSKREQVQS